MPAFVCVRPCLCESVGVLVCVLVCVCACVRSCVLAFHTHARTQTHSLTNIHMHQHTDAVSCVSTVANNYTELKECNTLWITDLAMPW